MSALALAAAPLTTATLDADGLAGTGETVLFWVLAPIMVLAALGLLFARKAVHAALAVVVVMISLAFLYVAQDAVFLGVVQVVVYTGAVMMLFLFVLMLVGVDASDSLVETIRGQRWIGALAGIGLGVVLAGVVGRAAYGPSQGLDSANEASNPVAIAHLVFGEYVLAFEVVGALLVTAALGALVYTHRTRLTPRVGQKERADARVAAGAHPVSLPAPGVYARHNAMDVPALGPDGQPIENSVPRVLRVRGQEADAAEFAARIERVLAGGSADARDLVGDEPTPPPAAHPEGAPVGVPDVDAAVSDSGQHGPSTGPGGVAGQEDRA
ncbi:NADH-quinone oxidoreductase subunit J [Cellulomonas fimi]|uniref:NADH-quinone oxidoreductase subunit J n=1 Tax=Cellulomonas fimi (strain ATCC 484 / DSM 20113 / JCM 1341 / CCUG 24087 / LMG 16345 / NBRC 15513 / NCIMB 8980 / NCTC 7547 / NRS-133) TaxID=590998 RepID=F4H1A8_CELFA|nr:NADH-ubiquinone/plastoquinone oxidoreductase chain 6 [Cellulomonas fimi ATCC 484]VEH28173.1 NADH-quinone oxidoreductase subunit J [Cellulomonas fimi]